MTVRVMIVDDFELVRAGLRMALETAPEVEVVGEAGDGAAAVAEADRLRPDVVLMDVRMPVFDGIEATRRIVSLYGPPVRILLLSTFDLDDYLLEALRAGVSGITLKDTPPDELVASIVAVARDDALVDPAGTVRLIRSVLSSQRPSPPPAGLDDLTTREREVLELVARGCSDAEIAAALGAGETAIEADVAQTLAKLGARDRVHAVLVAHESRVLRG